MHPRLLLLDRDGTLNRSLGSRPPNTPAEVALLPNVNPILSRYAADGWQLVIITNQGGVAHGYMTIEQACAVLDRTITLLSAPVSAAYLCPHMADASMPEYALDCPNRKPRPGAVLLALSAFGACSCDSLFVGDSSTDREAARAAGVPFCWADRFFRREIARGLKLPDKGWVQVHQRRPKGSVALYLQVTQRQNAVGHLALEPTADRVLLLDLQVADDYANNGIERFLVEAALEWAAERGFVRVCTRLERDAQGVDAFWEDIGFVDRAVDTALPVESRRVVLCCDVNERPPSCG